MSFLFFACAVVASMLFFLGAPGHLAVPAPGIEDFPRYQGVQEIPLLLDLLAALLAAGLPLARSLQELSLVSGRELRDGLVSVAGALELGAGWSAAWRPVLGAKTEGPLNQLELSMRFIALTGAPAAALLRSEARRLRHEVHRDLQQRAATLGVKLVLPMGLCALPAFMFLGVLPVLLSLMPGG